MAPGDGVPDSLTARLTRNVVLLSGVVAMLAVLARQFLQDTHALAITRDPAWYTWRTKVVLTADPSVLLTKHGPFGMLTGGYRVSTPVFGALLNRIAGIDPNRFTVLMEVGIPVLASVALGVFAYRHKRDPVLFLLTLVASVSLFLTTPFLGYLDDVTCLAFLALALPFLEPARTSWGARSAVALLAFLALLTHPTTMAIFALVLGLSTGLRLVAYRLSIRRTLEHDGPMLLSFGAGLVAGAAWWIAGLWGASAGFGESVLYQPYTSEFFRNRLHGWLQSMHPLYTVPLAVLAILWIGWMALRRRPEGRDLHARISVLWLLPIVGVFGWLVGKTYPYYRFLNPTLALMLLVGLGLWILTLAFVWLGRRIGDRWRILQWAAAAALLVAVGVLSFGPGLKAWRGQGPWIGGATLVDAAAANAYAEAQPGHPVVFVLHPKPDNTRAWGLSKQGMNITLGGLSGEVAARSYFFVGTADDWLAGKPTVTGAPLFDRLSRNFLADAKAGVGAPDQPPVVFLLSDFNHSAPDAAEGTLLPLTDSVSLVQGQGVAEPSASAQAAAQRANDGAAASLRTSAGLFDDPAHLLRVIGGLLLLLIVPGALASRWFEVDDFPSALALVPGLSFAMVTAAGIVVVSVARGPFTSGWAWATVVLAVAAAAVLWVLAPRVRGRRTRPSGAEARPQAPASSSSPAETTVTEPSA